MKWTLAVCVALLAGMWALRGSGAFSSAGETSSHLGEGQAPLREEVDLASTAVPATRELAREAGPDLEPLAVLDDHGGAIPDVAVQRSGVSVEPLLVSTSAEGIAALPALSPGQSLQVSKSGFFPRHLEFDEWQSLPRRAGAQAVRELTLHALGAVRVRVEDAAGEPVADAYVSVLPWDAELQSESLPPPGWPRFERPGHYTMESLALDGPIRGGTDARGEVLVSRLPVGVPLAVSASLRVVSTRAICEIDTRSRLAQVTLQGDSTTDLSGRVLAPDGRGVEGVWVRIRPSATAYELRITRPDGSYRFDGVPAGTWSLSVEGDPRAAATVVAEPPRAEVPDITITNTAEVRGRILAGEGDAPISGLALHARSQDSLQSTWAEPSGEFAFAVPPGPVRLEVVSGSILLWSGSVAAPEQDLTIDLRNQTSTVEARLLAFEGEVRCTFYDRAALDRAGSLRGLRGIARDCPTAEGGRVVIRALPPGVYGLLVSAEGSGSAWLPEIALTAGRLTSTEPIRLGYATLRGSLREASDALPATTEVGTTGIRGKCHSAASTQGSFSIPGLECGPREVYPMVCGGREGAGLVVVELSGNERDPTVELELPPVGRVICEVSRDGEPLPGALVYLAAPGSPDALGREQSSTSSELGVAALAPVAAGKYTLAVHEPAAGGRWGRLETVEFELRPGETELISVRWASDAREIVLLDGDRIVSDVVRVTVYVEGGGRSLSARVAPGGRVYCDLPPGPFLAQVIAPGSSLPAAEGIRWNPSSIATGTFKLGAEVAIARLGAGSIVLVPARDRATSAFPPIARLRSVGGIEPRIFENLPVLARSYDEVSGAYTFPSLPADSLVILSLAGGTRRELEVRCPGEHAVEVPWPAD